MRARSATAAAVASVLLATACEEVPAPPVGKSKPADYYKTSPNACDVLVPEVVQAFLGSRAEPEDATLRVNTEECEWERRTTEAAATTSRWRFLSAHVDLKEADTKSSGEDQAKAALAGMRKTLHKPGSTSIATCKATSGDCFYLVRYATKASKVNPATLTVVMRGHNMLIWVLATGQNFYPDQKDRMDSDAARLATAVAPRLR